MLIARRSFLVAASLAAVPTPSWAQGLPSGAFTHGVASGDPLPTSVILWTRFVSTGAGQIGWEVAEDEQFRRVAQRGRADVNAANDYCVKIDVRGLRPGRPYFYRFLAASGPSPTGRTRTAPAGAADSVSFALFSCANSAFGYFHAYGHAAQREDIDIALHAGDYIYEYQRGVYPGVNEAVPARLAALQPETEVVRLADYYARYATYHTDPDLLELRRLKPMSVVWDDHELTNDTWKDGAQNHQPATEGAWADRVAAASKAYFDWMPIRRPDPNTPRVYRSFDWGNLARFVFVDTRFIGRDEQLEYRNSLLPALNQPGADGAALARAYRAEFLDNPNRTMLGAAQERWFADTLAESKHAGHKWQVVTQQLVMLEQVAPQGLTRFLSPTASEGSRLYTATNERLSSLGLPINLDAWGGYPAARARFLAACAANASNALVLGGDSHNCWLNNLRAAEGNRLAAIEFAGGSVSSPGLERSLPQAQSGERESLIRSANPDLAWCDATRRGYGAFRLTRAACEASWVGFDDVRQPTASAPTITRMQSTPSANAGPGAWNIAS